MLSLLSCLSFACFELGLQCATLSELQVGWSSPIRVLLYLFVCFLNHSGLSGATEPVKVLNICRETYFKELVHMIVGGGKSSIWSSGQRARISGLLFHRLETDFLLLQAYEFFPWLDEAYPYY